MAQELWLCRVICSLSSRRDFHPESWPSWRVWETWVDVASVAPGSRTCMPASWHKQLNVRCIRQHRIGPIMLQYADGNQYRETWSFHVFTYSETHLQETELKLFGIRYSWNILTTMHRASTSMYSLTLRVRVTIPPQYGRNGTASLQITSRTQQTRRFYRWRGESSPACVVRAACGGPGGLPVGSGAHF